MRDFINAILAFIGAASLSDDEFNGLTIESADYDQATYEAVLAVLVARESVSEITDRLANYFKAKGVSITTGETGKSNIYVGGVLCS